MTKLNDKIMRSISNIEYEGGFCKRGRYNTFKCGRYEFIYFHDNSTIEVEGQKRTIKTLESFSKIFKKYCGEELVFSSTGP